MRSIVCKKLLYFFVIVFVFSCSSSRMDSRVQVEQKQNPDVIGTVNKTGAIDEIDKTTEASKIPGDLGEVVEPIAFREVWAYLHDGQEKYLKADMPVSDVGYFGALINNFGALSAVPKKSKISFFPGRVHLVLVCNHSGMTHMVLSPKYPLRDALIEDAVRNVVEQGYDGLQIDFEYVLSADKDNFLSFLQDLRKKLKKAKPSAIFSIAVPARTRTINQDPYDYTSVSRVVDKFFVMAYDEHWSSSKPGPVASIEWCKRIATYAQQTVDSEKLIMGQPFYGRTWGSERPNRAFFHSGMQRQVEEFNVDNLTRKEGILNFSYTIPLTITGYFDDALSIRHRSLMYKNMGVQSTGFWCLGQEDPDVWKHFEQPTSKGK